MRTYKGPFDPSHPDSTAFQMALGRLVAEASLCELHVDYCIWHFVGGKEIGHAVTSDLDFRRKVTIARRLFQSQLSDADRARAIDTVLSDLLRLYDKRNRFVHDYWLFGDGPGERNLLDLRSGQFRFTAVRAEKIATIAAEFTARTTLLQKAHLELVKHGR